MNYLSGLLTRFFRLIFFLIYRDFEGNDYFYQPVAVIDFKGKLSEDGKSGGHYTCHIKDIDTDYWFVTNDNTLPRKINADSVSKYGYVILYERL